MIRSQYVLGLFLALLSTAGMAGQVTVRVLSELDKYEPFEAHLFHAGHLWVGRSRKDLAADYHIEVYSPEGKLVVTQPLKHSLRYLYPYGEDRVIAVGVSAEPNISRYTILTLKNGRLGQALHDVPETAWANEGAGVPGRWYFTDPGGKVETVTTPADLGKPAQTIFTLGGGEPRYLSARIPGPSNPIFVGNALYVIMNPQIGLGGTNVARVDLDTEQPAQVFPFTRKQLNNMVYLAEQDLIAVSEAGASQVLLSKPGSSEIAATIPIAAGPARGLASLGHCLVAGSEKERQVSFIDLSKADHPLVAKWDLSGAGSKFLALRDVAVDPVSGRVYGRSAYPCVPFSACPDERNSVVLAEEADGATLAACTK